MSKQGEPRYFTRSVKDASEKGPYDREALKKSLERGLLKPETEARAEGAEEWTTLKDLFKPEEDAKERKVEEREFERAAAVRNMERRDERSGGNANIMVGVVMLIAGLALTAVSLSAGSSGGVIFVGLILFGIVRIIRGMATS